MFIKPDFKITTDKGDVTKDLTERVASVEVVQYAGGQSDQLILVLDDHRNNRVVLPELGDNISIAMGYKESDLVEHGKYQVAEYAISGARDSLTIYANKFTWTADLKSPIQKSWPSTEDDPLTIKKLVDEIAATNGLQSRVNPDLGQINLPAIEQSESLLHLLTRLASRYDATARIVEDYLIFMPRCSGLSRSGEPLPEASLDREKLIRWEMLSSGWPAFNSCKAYYHDFIAAERKSVTAGSGSPCYTLPNTLADEAAATNAAGARLNDFKRTTNTLNVTSVGEPNLMAGGVVSLSQVHDGIDGRWCITQVRHRIDPSGFVSSFECESLQ